MSKREHRHLRAEQTEKTPALQNYQVIAKVIQSPGADCFIVTYAERRKLGVSTQDLSQNEAKCVESPSPSNEDTTTASSIKELQDGVSSLDISSTKPETQANEIERTDNTEESAKSTAIQGEEKYEEVLVKGLARLPTKFKRRIWVQAGSFVVMEPCVAISKTDGTQSKITHDIVRILTTEQLRNLHSAGQLSLKFELSFQKPQTAASSGLLQGRGKLAAVPIGFLPRGSSDEESDEDPLPIGGGPLNRRKYGRGESSSSSSEDEDEDED